MLAGVSRETFEAQRQVDELARLFFLFVDVAEFLDDTIRFFLRFLRAPERVAEGQVERAVGYELRKAIHLAVAHAEDTARVAQHRLRGHGTVRDDLADVIAT